MEVAPDAPQSSTGPWICEQTKHQHLTTTPVPNELGLCEYVTNIQFCTDKLPTVADQRNHIQIRLLFVFQSV